MFNCKIGYGIEEFAAEAYDKPNDRDNNIDGYDYDKSLSNQDVAVYHNPKTEKTIVSWRGTSQVRDLKPDLGIALSRFANTKRFAEADEKLQEVVNKYGIENIRLSGHSLAGKIAQDLGVKYGIRTDTFNAGSTPLGISRDIINTISCNILPTQECKNSSLITNHTVAGDPISNWNFFSNQNHKIYRARSLNPHSMSNFLGMDIA